MKLHVKRPSHRMKSIASCIMESNHLKQNLLEKYRNLTKEGIYRIVNKWVFHSRISLSFQLGVSNRLEFLLYKWSRIEVDMNRQAWMMTPVKSPKNNNSSNSNNKSMTMFKNSTQEPTPYWLNHHLRLMRHLMDKEDSHINRSSSSNQLC